MTRSFFYRPCLLHTRILEQARFTPLTYNAPARAIFQSAHRTFSTSRSRHSDSKDDGRTHYEVLGVAIDASQADIKKSFYALSRETHPDIHPNDPTASAKFARISESYHLLSDPSKRQRYDREFIVPRQERGPQGASGVPRGSYAGSRPASGLSKRRGTFRGPPPSFYTQGEYGTTGSRRDAPGASNPNASSSSANDESQNTYNNANGFASGAANADFNAQSHQRTQSAEDTRRMTRRQAALAAAQEEMEQEQNFWVRVVVVLGVFVGAVGLGSFIGGSSTGVSNSSSQEQKKAERETQVWGTRRKGVLSG